jgi:hypothetical protein
MMKASLLLLLLVPAPPAGDETLWVEGEKPTASTFQKHGWYDAVKKDVLSGGDWLSHYGGAPGEASWALDVKQGGDYVFWVRCNNLMVTQHYRIDQGDWIPCDLAAEPREEMMISPQPDHRSLSWNKLGAVKLTPGAHAVAFRISSKLSNHGGIDCFVLTNAGFVPSGARKPAGRVAAAPGDWFEVIPDEDAFSPQSIIDLSGLLPKPAGKAGFVQRQGASLLQGGKPVKFWGCGANFDPDKSRPWLSRWARWLAKHGINMVRQHTVADAVGPLKGGAFDPKRIDAFDWWCAELRKNGIHMTWSMFYPYAVTREDGYELFDDLPVLHGNPNLRSSSGLATIEPKLQDLELAYTKAVLEHKNPYTGFRYIDDPALAVLEVRNEDSIFWHYPLNDLVTGKLAPKHAARLRARWADWLKARYGTDEKLKEVWGAGLRGGDGLSNASMAGYAGWEMGPDGPTQNKREVRRMGDWIRFLAEEQRAGYERREKALRAAGFKAVTVSTAWRAGGPAADPANTWSDDAMGMIDRHNYLGGGDGGHSVKEGKVHAETHMGTPGGGLLSVGLYQVEDKPFSITEWTQLPPNPWKAEAAPLIAFYGMGLQGWDASYHFLSSRNRLGAGWPNLSSYVTDTPHYMGQFPALAFAVHKGHIKEGAIAAARRMKIDALFQGIDPLQQDFTGGGYDAKALKGSLATPQEILAIGRVTTAFGEGRPSEKLDWATLWDKEKKIVRSVTGELAWDYGRRIVTVASPRTQAVLGFAGGTSHDLPGVKVDVKTPFVSLIFTPLDDLPLAASKHILITAMARDRQAGTEYSEDGATLLKAGAPPLSMEPVQATITLKGAAPAEVKAVDLYGVPTSVAVPVQGGTFTIDGRWQAYYYQVKR